MIAQSIGGTLSLKIRVCRASNSSLGNSVDGPFVESWMIDADRFEYGLQSSMPTLDLSGRSQVDGKEVGVTYRVQGAKKTLNLDRPERIVQEVDGKETSSIPGDPEDVRRILLGKREPTEKRGGYSIEVVAKA